MRNPPLRQIAAAAPLLGLFLSGCAVVLAEQAERAYYRGEYEKAGHLAEQALKSDPEMIQAKKVLGRLLVRRGADALERDDFAEARRYFEEAKRTDPGSPNAWEYLKIVDMAERMKELEARGRPSERLRERESFESRGREYEPRPRARPPASTERLPSRPAEETSAKGPAARQAAILYDAPSPLASETGRIERGTSLTVLRELEGWYEVETGDGRRGYVRTDSIQRD